MKKLLLMRHAKSSWKDPSLADFDRPLNKRGKGDAPRMGYFLMETGMNIDVILCSPAKRAKETVKSFLQEYPFEGELIYVGDLYHADHDIYLSLLNDLPLNIDTAMIVGHNPEMDYFLDMVCDVYEHMVTASIAEIDLPIEKWDEFDSETLGELVNFWKPREI